MRGGNMPRQLLSFGTLGLTLLSFLALSRALHFEVTTPYEGEIMSQQDVYFEFELKEWDGVGEVLLQINGNEAFRTKNAYTKITAPGLPSGLHYLLLYHLNTEGEPSGTQADIPFEVTMLQDPETIVPFPEGSVGIRSEDLPLHPDEDPSTYSGRVQRMLFNHQYPEEAKCKGAPYLIWEPWGIVGFGAQLLGLRVAMSLGLQTDRIVVGNPEWENNLVNSELKWRFNLTHSDQGSPWGDKGSLQHISHCARFSNVGDSVRAVPGVDMHDPTITNVRVAGDLWGTENRERLFDMPEAATRILPEVPNLFWWWTETTHFLHRPTEKLGTFVEAQKVRMGWKHPIIGIHMRLGVDKNREAQRFPTKYYIHEARRIRKLFGGVGTIFVCSDRRRAIDKMIREYGQEFEILVQPRVDDALPMEYVHTDLTLLGEADYLIFTFSSNFGMAAFYLNSFLHGHRPTYVSMDDLFEGFRYYGHQMTLTYNSQTGLNELGIRKCASQWSWRGRTLLLTEDKREDAIEICDELMGQDTCKEPRLVRDRDTGELIWDKYQCEQVDDYDACYNQLLDNFRVLMRETTDVVEKGECEEECDDHGCQSLSAGNRRVLGFGVKLPHGEL